ncbi:MAG: PEP-CTERM sorting domain-containing protein [Bryobacteraceae bacterium]|jgi:hypothetical protein
MRLIGLVMMVVMVAGATTITIDVVPSLGPNPWASPSFGAYTDNALTELLAGTSGIGSGPSFYGINYTFDFEDATVTNYPSWRGTADPAPPYDAESGTSYFVGTHILVDENATFHPADVYVWQFSTDVPIDPWHWGPFYLSASSLSGMRGYLDGTEVTPLAMDSVIDELVYVGIAGAYDARTGTDAGFTSGQAGLDAAIAEYRDAYGANIVTTCYALHYTVNGTTSNGGTTVCSEPPPVPEPATFVLGGAGLLGLLLLKRRR